MRRRERRLGRAACLAFVLIAGDARANEGRRRFLEERRCWIESALTSIHERGPATTSRDRFVTLSLDGDAQSYVQCIFQDHDTRMLCEASSGAHRYGDSQGMRLDIAPESVAALKALGFTRPDPKGNFVQVVELGSPPRLGPVATLMLASLHDAYRADTTSTLAWNAPMASIDYTGCVLAYVRIIRRR